MRMQLLNLRQRLGSSIIMNFELSTLNEERCSNDLVEGTTIRDTSDLLCGIEYFNSAPLSDISSSVYFMFIMILDGRIWILLPPASL